MVESNVSLMMEYWWCIILSTSCPCIAMHVVVCLDWIMQTRPVTPLLRAPFCWFPPVACSQMYGHHLVPFLYKEYHHSHEDPSPESQQQPLTDNTTTTLYYKIMKNFVVKYFIDLDSKWKLNSWSIFDSFLWRRSFNSIARSVSNKLGYQGLKCWYMKLEC